MKVDFRPAIFSTLVGIGNCKHQIQTSDEVPNDEFTIASMKFVSLRQDIFLYYGGIELSDLLHSITLDDALDRHSIGPLPNLTHAFQSINFRYRNNMH